MKRGGKQRIKEFGKRDRPFEKFLVTRSEEALRFCVYVYVFDLRDTTESVFQRRKVIQKHGDIPVNSMKGVRNSGSRSNVSKSADPKNRRHRGGGGRRRRERKRMEEKVGEVKKKIKKVGQLSFARAIDPADRVANP